MMASANPQLSPFLPSLMEELFHVSVIQMEVKMSINVIHLEANVSANLMSLASPAPDVNRSTSVSLTVNNVSVQKQPRVMRRLETASVPHLSLELMKTPVLSVR